MREDGPASEPVRDEPAPRPVCATHRHFTGRVVSLRTDVVDLGPAGRVDRDVVEHPGAVGVIAVDAELRVLLVRQYRHPVGCLLWEPPAGLLDIPGEDPLTAARRELAEEAGYQAAEWAVLVDAFTSPGGSTERCAFTSHANSRRFRRKTGTWVLPRSTTCPPAGCPSPMRDARS